MPHFYHPLLLLYVITNVPGICLNKEPGRAWSSNWLRSQHKFPSLYMFWHFLAESLCSEKLQKETVSLRLPFNIRLNFWGPIENLSKCQPNFNNTIQTDRTDNQDNFCPDLNILPRKPEEDSVLSGSPTTKVGWRTWLDSAHQVNMLDQIAGSFLPHGVHLWRDITLSVQCTPLRNIHPKKQFVNHEEDNKKGITSAWNIFPN